MKKTGLFLVIVGFGLCLSAAVLPAEKLEAGKAAFFLQGGKMVVGELADLSRTRLVFTLRNGEEIAMHRVWMINFVNTDWNFPAEREKMEKDQHYLFFRNDRMTSGKIIDFSHNQGFEFDTEEKVPLGQVGRIYFTNELPAAYKERLAEQAEQQPSFVGSFSGQVAMAAGAGLQTVTLTLNADRTALLTRMSPQGQAPMAEQGTWSQNPDGTITVQTGAQGRIIRRAQTAPLIFRLEGDQLVAVQFDARVWGSGGLRLKRT